MGRQPLDRVAPASYRIGRRPALTLSEVHLALASGAERYHESVSRRYVIAFPCSLFPSGVHMPRIGSIPFRLVLALCGIFLCAIPAPASEPPWLEIPSAHFTVITDAGDKKGREVALRFEQMRAVFANLLTKDRLNQSVPLAILALKNDKSYYQVAPL